MMSKKTSLLMVASLSAVILAGCASSPTRFATSTQKAASWENLGVTPNGNVMNEIDRRSIRRQGDRVVFRDRKTIFNPARESFLKTPVHKQSLNTWEIDCRHRTYRLIDTVLYDANGRLLSSYQYRESQTRHQPIAPNSASFYQFNAVCDSEGNPLTRLLNLD